MSAMQTGTGATAHRFCSLETIGGFLDGQTFEFDDGLNCIVIGRGTGKTAVVEFMRCAMDAVPGDWEARDGTEGLVDRNLQGGRVQLGVRTREGGLSTQEIAKLWKILARHARGRSLTIMRRTAGLVLKRVRV